MFPPRRILVPMDDSPLSAEALDAALTLAESFGGTIIPVFVRPPPTSDNTRWRDDVEIAELESSLRASVWSRLRNGHQLPPQRLQPEIRTGAPETCILEAADHHAADLIIMGTHGRQGLLEALTGSTTERVLRGSRTNLLVLREAEA